MSKNAKKPARKLPKYLSDDIIIERLRTANLVLRKENKRVLVEFDRKSGLEAVLYDTVQAAPPIKIPKPAKLSKNKTDETLVLALACLHIGEVVKKGAMGGLNEYNVDIAVRRFQFCIEEVISFTTDNMRTHRFNEIKVILMGDMVSGDIHDELKDTNEVHIVEQVHIAATVIAQGIMELARVFPKVEVVCVSGNHGRVEKEKYFKNKQIRSWVMRPIPISNFFSAIRRT